MTFRVVIAQEVLAAIDAQVGYYLTESAPQDAVIAWLAGLYDRIDGLYTMPRRFPVARAVTRAKGYEVRRMNHGEHAVFYRVRDAAQTVEIIAFRHGRQRPWLEGEARGRPARGGH